LKKDAFTPPKKFDWILLKSQEIIKGEIISLYQEDIEFDSDELGIMTVDWTEVSILKSVNKMSVRLNSGLIVQGRLVVVDDKIHLIDSDGKKSIYPSSELNTVAKTSAREVGLWDGEFTFGFDFKDGNSEKLDFLVSTDLRRLTASSRIKISYLTQFSKASQEQTDNNHRLNTTYDLFYSKNIFVRLVDFEFFKDKFQNIKNRTTFGVSLGYLILDNSKHEWDISIGPSIQQTTYIDVAQGNKETETSPVAQFSTDYEYEITKDIDFELSYRVQFVNPESGHRLHNLNSGFDIELIDDFDVNIISIIDRVEKPIQTSDGTVPKQNDYTFSFGISYEF
jgi:putative salt-induced outer membrane protein YdiY